jgi:hypothetical protein
MNVIRVFAVAAGLLAARAEAKQSAFRLTAMTPTATGGMVTLTFDNDWGNATNNENNKIVELKLHKHPLNWQQPGTLLGKFELLGTGSIQVTVDYALHGLVPGQQFTFSGKWDRSRHRWGELHGRPGGVLTAVTPTTSAIQNSRLARLMRPRAPRATRPFRGR